MIQVAIYDHQVWKNWTPHLAYENYLDFFTGLECEDFEMVRPLLFSLKELKDNALRNFLQKDTQQRARQAAEAEKPTEILDLQANIDKDAILLAAAERIDWVLKDKTHYFHKGGDSTTNKVPFCSSS